MKREHLEHILRAASTICEEPDFIVIGSQAIHASLEYVEETDIVQSMEADLYPLYSPEKFELLNAIGEMSAFHTQYGYYADGVDENTAVLPSSWQTRLIRISGPMTETGTGFRANGLCLERHDLVISKLVAGRPKDINFFRALVRLHALDAATLRARLADTKVTEVKRKLIEVQIIAGFSAP